MCEKCERAKEFGRMAAEEYMRSGGCAVLVTVTEVQGGHALNLYSDMETADAQSICRMAGREDVPPVETHEARGMAH